MDKPKLLITEDDDSVRSFLEMALALDGYDITLAHDGADAVEKLQEAEGNFDLLLSDIQMPIMDGIALALQVARDYPTMTIVFMTGYAHQRERAHGLDHLVYDVIMKPFTLADIRETVRKAMDHALAKKDA